MRRHGTKFDIQADVAILRELQKTVGQASRLHRQDAYPTGLTPSAAGIRDFDRCGVTFLPIPIGYSSDSISISIRE
jgi:hypothetical protein